MTFRLGHTQSGGALRRPLGDGSDDAGRLDERKSRSRDAAEPTGFGPPGAWA